MNQSNSNNTTAMAVREETTRYVLFSKKTVVVLLVIIALLTAALVHLEIRKANLNEQQAYVISVWITAQEDYLLYSYGMLPIDVELEEMRETWMSNPCYETATQYADALEEVIANLEDDYTSQTDYFLSEGIFV